MTKEHKRDRLCSGRYARHAATVGLCLGLLAGCGGGAGPAADAQTATAQACASGEAACGGATDAHAKLAAVHPRPAAPLVDTSAAKPWSRRSTWQGTVPPDGSDVQIPAGKMVRLDVNANVGRLQVDGVLVCDPGRTVELRARRIVVSGKLLCGSSVSPALGQFTVTMTSSASDVAASVGADPQAPGAGSGADAGVNGILVMSGGMLQLFGEERNAWTQLAATAEAGDTTLTLAETTGWRPNEVIVLASTDFNPRHAEELRVTAVDGNRVSFTPALQYRHWGVLQTFENNNASGLKTLDERAEVGLLSRNIRIRGLQSTADQGDGAHVMAMRGATMYVAGVEFANVGQKSIFRRYPIHWHMVGDGAGQFIMDSSIHHSFNRCVTVHGTRNVLVQGNVCYDHIGHGYFLEDGVETGNVFDRNLGVLTRVGALLGSDTGNPDLMRTSGNPKLGPPTFWISNADNTLTGNRAAGSEGSGYWYPSLDRPSGESASASNIRPNRAPLRKFSGNTVHSAQVGLVLGFGGDSPEDDWYYAGGTYEDVTAYKIYGETGGQAGSIWVRGGGVKFRNFVTADSRHHYNVAFDGQLEGALLVGLSANGQELPWFENVGVGYYDGPFSVRNAHFARFIPNPDQTVAALSQVDGSRTSVDNNLEGLSFDAESVRFDWVKPAGNNTALRDVDGSLTGMVNASIVGTDNPTMNDDSCTQLPGVPRSPMYACARHNVSVEIKPQTGASTDPGNLHIQRTNTQAGVSLPGFCRGCGGAPPWYQSNVLSGTDYTYTFDDPGQLTPVFEVRLVGGTAVQDRRD